MPERFEVSPKEADQRLDKLLRQHFPDLSFGQTQKLIRGGRVRINGKRCKAADRVPAGAIITLPFQGESQAAADPAKALDALTLYEDQDMRVLNKPAGLAVQGGSQVTRHVAGMLTGTQLRLVHRLDRDTSGLLVLGKGGLNAKLLTRAFADHEVQKTYLALVKSVDKSIQDGTLTMPLQKVYQGGEDRMAIAGQDGQEAITDFNLLARSTSGPCLLEMSPRTGRTHQLRVHGAHMFGGILGDTKYGQAQSVAPTLMLHAWRLKLTHPDTGENMEFEAPIPGAFQFQLNHFDLSLPQEWSPV